MGITERSLTSITIRISQENLRDPFHSPTFPPTSFLSSSSLFSIIPSLILIQRYLLIKNSKLNSPNPFLTLNPYYLRISILLSFNSKIISGYRSTKLRFLIRLIFFQGKILFISLVRWSEEEGVIENWSATRSMGVLNRRRVTDNFNHFIERLINIQVFRMLRWTGNEEGGDPRDSLSNFIILPSINKVGGRNIVVAGDNRLAPSPFN